MLQFSESSTNKLRTKFSLLKLCQIVSNSESPELDANLDFKTIQFKSFKKSARTKSNFF